jgi:hypothetical protein
MLDILCDFLIITRTITGGVTIPDGTNASSNTATSGVKESASN